MNHFNFESWKWYLGLSLVYVVVDVALYFSIDALKLSTELSRSSLKILSVITLPILGTLWSLELLAEETFRTSSEIDAENRWISLEWCFYLFSLSTVLALIGLSWIVTS